MDIYLRLLGGRKLFVEFARSASVPRGFEMRRENSEILLWLGRWHLIYTPAHWSPVSGEVLDARQHSI